MQQKPTRVFLDLQPVGYRRPAGADPFTYQDKRPVRWRASWWARGPGGEIYRSKIVPTRDEAVRLARRWLEQNRKETPARSAWNLIDTTDQPERFGYSHGAPTEKKTAAQLDTEIAAVLGKASR